MVTEERNKPPNAFPIQPQTASGPSMFQLLQIYPRLNLQQEVKWLHIFLFPQIHVILYRLFSKAFLCKAKRKQRSHNLIISLFLRKNGEFKLQPCKQPAVHSSPQRGMMCHLRIWHPLKKRNFAYFCSTD